MFEICVKSSDQRNWSAVTKWEKRNIISNKSSQSINKFDSQEDEQKKKSLCYVR